MKSAKASRKQANENQNEEAQQNETNKENAQPPNNSQSSNKDEKQVVEVPHLKLENINNKNA